MVDFFYKKFKECKALLWCGLKKYKYLLLFIVCVICTITILCCVSDNLFLKNVKLLLKRIFPFNDKRLDELCFFVMVGGISIAIALYISLQNLFKINDIGLKTLLKLGFILKVVIIFELVKLILYKHMGLLDSLTHIKPLGYMLGGLIAIVGLYLTYKRTEVINNQLDNAKKQLQVNKEQHLANLYETRFNNAIILLGSDSISVRLGGVASLVDLTKHKYIDMKEYKDNKYKAQEYLEENVTLLFMHLEELYNTSTLGIAIADSPNRDNILYAIHEGELNSLINIKDYYIERPRGKIMPLGFSITPTSEEIVKTLLYISKLLNMFGPSQYFATNLVLSCVEINFDLSNLHFMQGVMGINFKKANGVYTNLLFNSPKESVKFKNKQSINNIKFDNNIKEFNRDLLTSEDIT